DLRRYRGCIRTGSHQPGIGARAKRQSQRIEQDGLARSRVAREDTQPGVTLQVEALDEHDIADCELPQHARWRINPGSPLAASAWKSAHMPDGTTRCPASLGRGA